VQTLTFSPDGTRIASLGADNRLKLFDVAARRDKLLPVTVGQTSQVFCFAFSPDSAFLATGGPPLSDGNSIRIWEPSTGTIRHRLPGKTIVTALTYISNGMLASSDLYGRVVIWSTKSAKPLHEWQLPGPANCLVVSRDGKYLITGNANGTLYVLRWK
jgi:WD40 repeat protein